jgi:hypothetical protein
VPFRASGLTVRAMFGADVLQGSLCARIVSLTNFYSRRSGEEVSRGSAAFRMRVLGAVLAAAGMRRM